MFKILAQMAGALGKFDTDTQLLFLRFVIRAAQQPNSALFVKESLQKILDDLDAPAAYSPRQVVVTAREMPKR